MDKTKSFSEGDEGKAADTQIDTLCKNLLQNLEDGKEINIQEGIKGILYMLFSIKTKYIERLENKIDFLEDQNIELSQKVASLEKKMIGIECTQNATKIILKNAPFHDGVKAKNDENFSQTKEVVQDFLQDIDMDYESVTDCRRFGRNKSTKNIGPPAIEITFDSVGSKHAAFRNLVNLRNSTKFKTAHVQDYIPMILTQDYKKAAAHAFELRKNKKNKTRIKIINYEVTLIAYPAKGKGFSKDPKIIPNSAWK